MNGSGFDTLTRKLSHLRSRRSVTQVLLGVALGGSSGLIALDDTDAQRRQHDKRRKRNDHRKQDRRPQPQPGAQADKKKGKKSKPCPPCRKRKQGKCKGALTDGIACPGGICRAGNCVPTTSPPPCTPSCGIRVCGGDDGCGKSCGTCTGGLSCQDGQCVPACAGDLTDCSGTCVNLQTDATNC